MLPNDVNTYSEAEISVTDRFPCSDEPILAELTRFCKREMQAKLLETICVDEQIWYNNGQANYTAIGRKLGISGEAVRQMITDLRSNKILKSTLYKLVSH